MPLDLLLSYRSTTQWFAAFRGLSRILCGLPRQVLPPSYPSCRAASARHDVGVDDRGRALLSTGFLLLLLCACNTSNTSSTTASTGAVALQAAPRECQMGPARAAPVPFEQTVTAMGGHVPTWFPETDFGLVSAWSMEGGPANFTWATWTDQRCRTVTVSYYLDQDGGPPSWKVQYDKAKACGNSVMGMGECIGLRVALPTTGGLGVQTIGLSRAEAEQLVQSIPL
jgi:hypothetical protein